MEELLQANLNKGEEVLWRSQPESFETLDRTHKADFIRKIVIGLAIVIAFTLLMLSFGKMNGKVLFLVGLITLLCAIPVFNIFSDASKLRKTEYIATTERLIVLRDVVRSVYYSQLHTAAFKEDIDGHVSLVCGPEAVNAKPCKRREICVVGAGIAESDSECTRFCFYSPANREALAKLLHEKIPSLF